MSDRARRRLGASDIGWAVAVLAFVQAGLVIVAQPGADNAAIHLIGVAVIVLALALAVVALLRARAAPGSARSAAAAVIAGAALRAWALMPLTYGHATPVIPILPQTQTLALVAAYVLLIGGALALTARLGGDAPWGSSAAIAGAGTLAVFAMLGFAAFGPVPAFDVGLTQRDMFAALLLGIDCALLGAVSLSMLRSLRVDGGASSRAWLWAMLGLLMVAMGDTIQPLLILPDAVEYTPILWGLGYALAAIASSTKADARAG